MKKHFTQEGQPRHCKYYGANDLTRFRIVELSPVQFRVDFKVKLLFGFIHYWDKNLYVYTNYGCDTIGTNIDPLVFKTLDQAKFYVARSNRKLICFKKHQPRIHSAQK